MKIIKDGDKQLVGPKGMIAECEQCGCVFTFNAFEARELSNGGDGSVWFAACPYCKYGQGSYDTGYPKNEELNRRVMETHARLRAMIPENT